MTHGNHMGTKHDATDESTNSCTRLAWETPTLVSADIEKTAANVDSFTDGVTSTGYRYGS